MHMNTRIFQGQKGSLVLACEVMSSCGGRSPKTAIGVVGVVTIATAEDARACVSDFQGRWPVDP